MNKRLKYEKYMGIGNIITIDLHNGYTVISLIHCKDINMYEVELRITENSTNKWDFINNAQRLEFNTNNIYSAILKQVSTFLEEGFFDYYIARYEYELKCFDIGDDFLEKERLCDANAS